MSVAQNLGYAVIQVVHNLGAVATVGGSLSAVVLRERAIRQKLSHLVLGGWVTQAASGAAFGAISYYFYGKFPDISGIAIYALGIKMVCASLGILLFLTYLWRSAQWQDATVDRAWLSSAVLALTAISAAAFLRWFA
jgi:hypothetical protein